MHSNSKSIFKNQAIIDYYSAPINIHVDLNEHPLILKDINDDEKDKIASLIACAIFIGDIKATTFFKMQIDRQEMKEQDKQRFLNIILDKMREMKIINYRRPEGSLEYDLEVEKLKIYPTFCEYAVRFECRHGVSPKINPRSREETLVIFAIEKEQKDNGSPAYTFQFMLGFFLEPWLGIHTSERHERLLDSYKTTSDDAAPLHRLFTEGNYLEFYALMQLILGKENTIPPFRHVVVHNNSESFAAVMAELKFTQDSPEADELMIIAIKYGQTHAVDYFHKLGIKFELDSNIIRDLIRKHHSTLDLCLKIKSNENNYQEIIKQVYKEALDIGDLEVVKNLTENHPINQDEIYKITTEYGFNNRYSNVRYHLTCKTVKELALKEQKLADFLLDLIKNANTQEKITSLLSLLNYLREDKKINIVKLCGDASLFLKAILGFFIRSPNNPESKENNIAKVQLVSCLIQEDNAPTKVLLQTPLDKEGLCLLESAIQVGCCFEVIDHLIKLHEAHKIPLPCNALTHSLKVNNCEVTHHLLVEKKLSFSINVNHALLCLAAGAGISGADYHSKEFKNSKIEQEMVSYLYESYGADPFSPFECDEGLFQSVIDCIGSRRAINPEAIGGLIKLYQIYFDKISDILKQFVEPGVLNHLVLTYANNTPYFASLNDNQFFACKKDREQTLNCPVADQKEDKPNGYHYRTTKTS